MTYTVTIPIPQGATGPRVGGEGGRDMLTISLPIPKSSNPNAKGYGGHWAKQAAAKKADRRLSHMLALQALNGQPAPKWTAGKILAVWMVKNPAHRPDEGNAHSRLKATIDGLVDAGIFVDDDNVTTEIIREVGPNPGVVIHVKPKENTHDHA